VPLVIVKSAASSPDFDHVTAPVWPTVAGVGEVQAAFSATEASARPETVSDSATSVTASVTGVESPLALVARTRNSYWVPAVRPLTVAETASAGVVAKVVQADAVSSRYCTLKPVSCEALSVQASAALVVEGMATERPVGAAGGIRMMTVPPRERREASVSVSTGGRT